MTFPVDQFVSLAKANGQLALKLAEIARESGEEYVKISGKAGAQLADKVQTFKPGALPKADSKGVHTLLAQIEKSRAAAMEKAQAALAEWQGTLQEAFETASDRNEGMEAFETLMQPWLNIVINAPAQAAKTTAKSHTKPDAKSSS